MPEHLLFRLCVQPKVDRVVGADMTVPSLRIISVHTTRLSLDYFLAEVVTVAVSAWQNRR
jgi:hypothetical protein